MRAAASDEDRLAPGFAELLYDMAAEEAAAAGQEDALMREVSHGW